MPAGCIYLVPVPIGNLGDITLRALETLKRADLIACEDTRKTRFLLNHYEIKAPRLLSLHKYNEKKRCAEILELLKSGTDLVIVSDAGSPGISDPAMLVVQSAIAENVSIVPLPGATALIPALTASGMDISSFQFLGFLPLKLKDRTRQLERIRDYPSVSVLYEAPHRIRTTLDDIHSRCGSRQICIGREISKLHEEFIRGETTAILENYQITEKGEFVVLIGPQTSLEQQSELEIESFIDRGLAEGTSLKSLAAHVAASFGINRNKAYQSVLERKKTSR